MDGRLRVRWLPLYYAAAEDGGQEQLEGVRPSLQTVASTDVLSVVVLHEGGVMGHAVARRLGKAGWRLSPPVVEPPAAATDGASVRLQELADSGRLCLTVQVAESGAGCQRVGPLRTTKGVQRWVHEGT
eukprot:14672301-Alexandrium_andersonii.AAC.1